MMPIAKVQLEDGRIARFEVPEGTTQEQVLQFAQQMNAQSPPQEKMADNLSGPSADQNLPPRNIAQFDDGGDVSFIAGLSKGFNRGLEKMTGGLSQRGFEAIIPQLEASVNKLKSDLSNDLIPDDQLVRSLQRIEQLEGVISKGKSNLSNFDISESARRDEFKKVSDSAPVSSFIGEAVGQGSGAAMLAPIEAALPASIAGKALAGATVGGIAAGGQPTVGDESALENAKLGAAVGASAPLAFAAAAPVLGAAAKPVKQKLFNYFGKPSPQQQRIIDAIAENPRNPDFAKFDIIDGIPKQQAALKLAVKQSGSPELVGVIKASSKADRAAARNMLKIIKQGKLDPLFADRVRPGHVVGKSLAERLSALKELNSQAGKSLDEVARKSLKGQSVDISSAKQSFKQKLDDLRVAYNPQTGKVDYTGSALEGEGGGAARDLIKRLAKTLKSDSVDASDAHFVKRLIDQKVSFGKSDGGFSGEIDRAIKGLRSEINTSIGQKVERYAAANKKYSKTVSAIDNFQDTVGKKVNLDSANALGVSSRAFTNNTQKRDNILGNLSEIQEVLAENGVKFKDDILTQVNISNALEKRFQTQGATALDSSITKGAQNAIGKSGLELGIDLIGSAVEKVKGVTDERALDALLNITN